MRAPTNISAAARAFLSGTEWQAAGIAPVAGDASARCYYRLRRGAQTAILMDASAIPACLPPYVQLSAHLRQLGFSAPEVLAADYENGCALIEDFGDATFTAMLEKGHDEEGLYALATDILIALHQIPQAAPAGWREYHPAQMLADIELYLEWVANGLPEAVKEEFRRRWLQVLPLAHEVPATLLLRDYHVANLMWLPQREGIRRAGLIDFQDAYRGPVTYDLMSLLEDARRDVSPSLREKMVQRYLQAFPYLPHQNFRDSLAILAAQRHTRVLSIFARLAMRDGKPEYQQRYSARVRRQLREALAHPTLQPVKEWFDCHGKLD